MAPADLADGKAVAGNLGGTVTGDDVIGTITLAANATGTGYDFAEDGLASKYLTLNMFLNTAPTPLQSLINYIDKSYADAGISTTAPVGISGKVAAPTITATPSSFVLNQGATQTVAGLQVNDNSLTSTTSNVQVTATVSNGTLAVSSTVTGARHNLAGYGLRDHQRDDHSAAVDDQYHAHRRRTELHAEFRVQRFRQPVGRRKRSGQYVVGHRPDRFDHGRDHGDRGAGHHIDQCLAGHWHRENLERRRPNDRRHLADQRHQRATATRSGTRHDQHLHDFEWWRDRHSSVEQRDRQRDDHCPVVGDHCRTGRDGRRYLHADQRFRRQRYAGPHLERSGQYRQRHGSDRYQVVTGFRRRTVGHHSGHRHEVIGFEYVTGSDRLCVNRSVAAHDHQRHDDIPGHERNHQLGDGHQAGITSSQVTGNGTGSVSITAPLAAINATLAGAAGLTYTPGLSFTGDTVSMSANDSLGNTTTASLTITS